MISQIIFYRYLRFLKLYVCVDAVLSVPGDAVFCTCSFPVELTSLIPELSTSISCSDLVTSLERNLYATLSVLSLLRNFLCKYDDSGAHSGSSPSPNGELSFSSSDSPESVLS